LEYIFMWRSCHIIDCVFISLASSLCRDTIIFLFLFDGRLMMSNEGIVGKEEKNAFITARAAW
jgi:hypothetical protein